MRIDGDEVWLERGNLSRDLSLCMADSTPSLQNILPAPAPVGCLLASVSLPAVNQPSARTVIRESTQQSAHHLSGNTPQDPLAAPGWDSLVAAHVDGSIFHTASWARVLQDTYGHRPVYFCRSAGNRLESLLPIMEISSPWSGRRGVSLPFTDFCAPLQSAPETVSSLYDQALEYGRSRGWRYLESRGNKAGWPGATPSLAFYGHVLELEPDPEALFKKLDSAVRRGIRKAQAVPLQIEFSSDLEAMRTFYRLHCQTRRRHGLPPQPFRFFENIVRHILTPAYGFVATARVQQQAVASAVFFHFGHHALYKFGASDFAYQHLRPNNLLMWESIRHCASSGFGRLHFGRTSLAHEGLRRFKLGFGAREETIEYCRYDFKKQAFVRDVDRVEGWFNPLFRSLPLPLLRLAGRLIYPHLS